MQETDWSTLKTKKKKKSLNLVTNQTQIPVTARPSRAFQILMNKKDRILSCVLCRERGLAV